MIRLLTIILLICSSISSIAQSVEFPLDELGKYTFSEVVELPGMKKDLLFSNGEKFMKKIKVLNSSKKYLESDESNSVIKNRGSFYVYRLGSLKKGIGGAVEYDIKLEIKAGKYRYTLTNFIFNEYQKNRYGKYEPVKGKYTPLEADVSSLNKKEWENHKKVVYDKSQELIQNLYGDMLYADEKKNKKVKKDADW